MLLKPYNSRSRSLCGGKEIKARVSPSESSIAKAYFQSLAFSIPPTEDRAFPEPLQRRCRCHVIQVDKAQAVMNTVQAG
jgi:hypothetical protein